jgi:SOS-response transcriptional repressor LexA
MTSRCTTRLPLDAPAFTFNGGEHLGGLALAKSNATNVRAIQAELPRDAGIQTGAEDRDADFPGERGIFGGHLVARHNVALDQPKFINHGLECQAQNMSSDWAVRIQRLMDEQRLRRPAFAAKLNVTQMTVSNWLSAKKEPRPEMYYRMARIWPDSAETPHLLKRAADISGAHQVPGFDKPAADVRRAPQAGRRAKFARGEDGAVEIPLLKDEAATGTPRQVQEKEFDRVLHFPGSLVPHPDKTVCIRVRGDSMSPVLEDGYIIAIDTAQTDRVRLYDSMVAARDPEGGVTIKWLRKVGNDEILLAQHTSRRHQPVVLSREGEPGWSIVGKVLWWIGMPP